MPTEFPRVEEGPACGAAQGLSPIRGHGGEQVVDPYKGKVALGGLLDYLPAIKRSRRMIFVACGTSYHATMACRQTIERLACVPVRAFPALPSFLDLQVVWFQCRLENVFLTPVTRILLRLVSCRH